MRYEAWGLGKSAGRRKRVIVEVIKMRPAGFSG
jgi:hypothetical protein